MGLKYSERHPWTPEQDDYLREIVPGRSIDDIIAMFNGHFGLELRRTQILARKRKLGLKTGVNSAWFSSRQPPHNKGKHNWWATANGFKPGNVTWNTREIGTERVDTNGFIEVKIAQPNVWKLKHHIIWEWLHGEIPKGDYIVFADGDRTNFDPDNLILVTRAEGAYLMARLNFKWVDADLTKAAVMMAKVHLQANERAGIKKRIRNRRNGKEEAVHSKERP